MITLKKGEEIIYQNIENDGPYTLFGNKGGDYYGKGNLLKDGSYTITVIAYAEPNGEGDILCEQSITFNYTNIPLQAIFHLEDQNAGIAIELVDGAYVRYYEDNCLFSYIDFTQDGQPFEPASVLITFSGPGLEFEQMENDPLFTSFGNDANGIDCEKLQEGTYTITVAAYSSYSLNGNLLGTFSITFHFVRDIPMPDIEGDYLIYDDEFRHRAQARELFNYLDYPEIEEGEEYAIIFRSKVKGSSYELYNCDNLIPYPLQEIRQEGDYYYYTLYEGPLRKPTDCFNFEVRLYEDEQKLIPAGKNGFSIYAEISETDRFLPLRLYNNDGDIVNTYQAQREETTPRITMENIEGNQLFLEPAGSYSNARISVKRIINDAAQQEEVVFETTTTAVNTLDLLPIIAEYYDNGWINTFMIDLTTYDGELTEEHMLDQTTYQFNLHLTSKEYYNRRELLGVRIYPNPSNGTFNLDFIKEVGEFTIYTPLGQKIYESKAFNQKLDLFQTGFYILRYDDYKGAVSADIIIIR
ncbi:hypothetical protein GCM10023331_28770 [Algivirga pacifica]|uniref:Secretion system C-terminal sorting domain-containing protein n=2 Tax=Algivirga pacifica TaxID=1162670 RepID=A0ABP9DE18_9BACT